jgi:ABC-type branched-subunit amino acid transport system substrate-binding protein
VGVEAAVARINRDSSLRAGLPPFCTIVANTLSKPSVGTAAIVDILPQTHGILGAFFSSVTKPCTLIAGARNIPMISPASTATDLSQKTVFPRFARTIAPDNKQALAILGLLCHHQWTEFVILHSQDDYG